MSGKRFSTSELVAAIRGGNPSAVISALDNGADIEEADIHGYSGLPLRTACFGGNKAIVDTLIRRGADVNARGSDGSGMPLKLAVRGKHYGIVALLLEHGSIVPPDVQISQESLADARKPELPPLDMPTLEKPELPLPEAEPDTSHFDIIENIDIRSSHGTDTNLLTMDLLRFNEDQAGSPSAPDQAEATKEGKTRFWKSGRNIR